jgi:hypothetical protein
VSQVQAAKVPRDHIAGQEEHMPEEHQGLQDK